MVRKRSHCIDCSDFQPGDQLGDCKQHKWSISMELAKKDKVCSYDCYRILEKIP